MTAPHHRHSRRRTEPNFNLRNYLLLTKALAFALVGEKLSKAEYKPPYSTIVGHPINEPVPLSQQSSATSVDQLSRSKSQVLPELKSQVFATPGVVLKLKMESFKSQASLLQLLQLFLSRRRYPSIVF
uniref:Uncharacterized protein n=1 Tax=Oryza brachyantha TaxID=4533 RepID=J3LVX7_ORYBR